MLQRKVCLVGDFAVGKTSLFNRFVYNRFSETYQSTIGVRVQRKLVTVQGQDMALVLWDTEGGQDSSSVRESYLLGATGAVIVCDLHRTNTILHCEEYAELLRRSNAHILLAMVGNKMDLVPPDHANIAVAHRVAALIQAPLTLASASRGEGVVELFQGLGEGLYRVRAT